MECAIDSKKFGPAEERVYMDTLGGAYLCMRHWMALMERLHGVEESHRLRGELETAW